MVETGVSRYTTDSLICHIRVTFLSPVDRTPGRALPSGLSRPRTDPWCRVPCHHAISHPCTVYLFGRYSAPANANPNLTLTLTLI